MQFKLSALFSVTLLVSSAVAICPGYNFGIADTGAITNGVGTCQSHHIVFLGVLD
jgi:hypothetical protein